MRKINIFLFALILMISHLFGQQSKNVTSIIVKTKAGKNIKLYTGSHALLIGVSEYTAGWSRLLTVPDEIKKIESALKLNGFQTRQIMNPDDNELEDAFKDFIDDYGYDKNNRLLFFFSGHGYSRAKGKKGYLVPTNAPNPNNDEKGFLRKALPMSQIIEWCKQMEAKHALLLFDSCFSGTIFKTKSLPVHPPHITDLISRPVRQFITAGDAGEEVPARSVFALSFLKAIRGEADFTKDGYVTGSELGIYLHDKVIYYRKGQTPQYGKIRDPELDEGDFVFLVSKASYPIFLRDYSKSLSSDEVTSMLKLKNFYDSEWNETGQGINHNYEPQTIAGKKVVFDYATGLMWQQAGSSDAMIYEDAKKWIDKLNDDNYGGFNNWRLPTLEEAMSLMESEHKNGDLYIDAKFDNKQRWIWTSDLVKGESWAWVVYFSSGGCSSRYLFYANDYVRAVRFGQ